MKPRFANIEPAEKVDTIQIKEEMEKDKSESKVDLLIGAYRTGEGKPVLMPVVHKVEKQIVNDPNLNHEYTWFLGMEKFNKVVPKLILGENSPAIKQERAFGAQTLSGNGALWLGAQFLLRHLQYKTVYLSAPTWDNHSLLFRYVGFTDLHCYRYWDSSSRGVDVDGLLEDLSNAPENSVIVLQMCAHNPTGCDLTQEQWISVADVIEKRNLFPIFDAAYQGFATGDVDKDAWPVRYFEERGFEFFIAQSFSKNFALYSERVGCLTVVLGEGRSADAVNMIAQLKLIDRASYNTPPKHGALTVSIILSDSSLQDEWKTYLKGMVERIHLMRRGLRERLETLGTPGSWEHITTQLGMFSFLGLTTQQVEYLRKKHHVYILSNSRTNISGLSLKNIDQVAFAIHDTLINVKG